MRYFLLLALLLFSKLAYADFVVGTCPPSSENYGNSQTAIFRRAVTGIYDPCAPIDAVAVPERDYDRWYLRVRLNYGTLIYDQVRNRSLYFSNLGLFLGSATLSRTRAIRNQSGFEIAIGYVWSHTTRGDIEYIATRNLSFTTGAFFGGGTITQITANIKNNVLLFNGYYEFTHLGRLKPYVTYGLGISDVSVRSNITSPILLFNTSATTRGIRLAWQLGVGARLILYPPRWSLDFSYRFIQLGNNVRTIPISGVQVNGRYAFSVLSLGIVYLF